MTNQAHVKAKIDLYNIISNHAMNDYKQANYNKHGKKYKKHRPYSLGFETLEAKKHYNMVYFNDCDSITLEQEEEVKYFLLIYRINRSEFLEDRGGNSYHGNNVNEKELQTV